MPNYLDLFAGAGGLSEGFTRAGFAPIAHVEMDKAACNTLRTRDAFHYLEKTNQLNVYAEYLARSITRDKFYEAIDSDVLNRTIQCEMSEDNLDSLFLLIEEKMRAQDIKHVDYIIGGPPCQAYSLVGRARDKNSMFGDKRNYLYKLYAKFLQHFEPDYFVFENVIGLLTARDQDGSRHLDNMLNLFKDLGYSVEYSKLNAKDYGVLQNRKRVILVGKHGTSKYYPALTPTDTSSVTVNEIFKDLPKLHAGEGTNLPVRTLHYTGKYLYEAKIKQCDNESVTLHVARPNIQRDLEIYRRAVHALSRGKRIRYTDLPERLRTQQNVTSFLDRFKVVDGNGHSSQTVVAHIAKDGHYFIHPDINQNRSLTPREAARLQSFPDNYYFEAATDRDSSRTAAFKQIGNAVPVLLAEAIATAMLKDS